jgi:ABC-type cobalamin/Fe3+-siderophores transport system ATPase subunit
MAEHTLSVSRLTALYGNKAVLRNITLSVTTGKIICLIGPNGGGKSTLLTLLAGIKPDTLKITADSGIPLFDGTPLVHFSRKETARHIAYMPQFEQSAWNYSVRDIVLTGRYAYTTGYGNYSRHDKEIAARAVAEAGIEKLADRKIYTLSGGEAQKVRIARALCQEPDILLLDEPASPLDFSYQEDLIALIIRQAHTDSKRGIIISIHDVNMAARFADRIILLAPPEENSASLCKIGTAQEILTDPLFERAYGTSFGIFTHPVYGCPQIYVKK